MRAGALLKLKLMFFFGVCEVFEAAVDGVGVCTAGIDAAGFESDAGVVRELTVGVTEEAAG